MKVKLLVTAILTAGIVLPAMADNQANIAEARGIIKQFATQLKGELKKGMKEGGPVNAINVCVKKAPEITNQVSASSGWTVTRTSLKPRTISNNPLPWERKVMEEFEARKAAGADPKTLDYSDIVEEDGKKVFRYMKAIPTGKVCLKCHGGDNVDPDVVTRLKSLYPSDKARGFKEGDIRGAFVLIKAF